MIASTFYIGRHRRDVNRRHESLGPFQVGPDGEFLLGFVDPSGEPPAVLAQSGIGAGGAADGGMLQSDQRMISSSTTRLNVRRPKE